MFKNFNNLLALLLGVVIIPLIWLLDGMGIIDVAGQVQGATIVVWTLIAQYYFRKKSSDGNGS